MTSAGVGAVAVALALLLSFTTLLARRGACRGDAFVAGAIGFSIAAIALFTLYPLGAMLAGAFREGVAPFVARLATERLWGLGCVTAGARCGAAWTTQ